MSLPSHEEPIVIARERERTLRIALPLAVLVYVSAALVILNGPQAPSLDPYAFLAGAAAMMALWIGTRTGRVSSSLAQAALLAVAAALLALHVASLFTGATYQDPQVSLFNVTYAFVPLLLTLFALLLPYPASLWSGLAAWLVFAGGTTVFTMPYWGQTPAREGLLPTLMLVWVGYPATLALLIGMARRHARMLQTYATKVRDVVRANGDAERSGLKFRSIFNQAAVGIALVDARGRWLSVNQRVCDITGYTAAELERTDFQSITHPDDLGADITLADKVMSHEIERYSMEKRYLRKDGSIVWVNLSVARLDGANGAEEDRFVTVIEDISQRKTAEEGLVRLRAELEARVLERTRELQLSSERWQERNKAVSIVNELVAFLLSAHDEAEACRIASTYMPRILGRSAGVLRLADGDMLIPAASWGDPGAPAAIAKSECWAARRSVTHQTRAGRSDLRCGHCHDIDAGCPTACEPMIVDGRIIGVLTVRWPADAQSAFESDAILVSTVAEQLALALSNIRLRAELHTLAVRDPLTGLHNRRHLTDHLPRAIANARRARTSVSVLLADVDHFKQFNDRFGHDAGDRVLKAVGGAMARSLREGDVAFRYGGEEFVAVLSDCMPEDAMRWAERLRSAIADASAQADPERKMPRITCSVGVASFPADGATASQLLEAADRALYAAKDAGRNCVRILKAA
jgi:diguanylate cyclase (GGDEF)-like protein/PAS domain S-box-containing protein